MDFKHYPPLSNYLWTKLQAFWIIFKGDIQLFDFICKNKNDMKTPNSKFDYIGILYFILISIMIIILLIYII